MPRWSAFVTGDDHLIEHLPGLIGDSSYTCNAEGSGYRVFSPDFEKLTSAREVYQVATQKLSGILAAIQIFGGRHGNLKCQNVREHNASGGRIRDTAFATTSIQVISPAQLDEAKSSHAGSPLANAVADLAGHDEMVGRALTIVSTNQFGWPQIYDIIELLTIDMIVQRRWGSRKALRDIRQTANPHRHPGSLDSHQLPETPPTLNEARALLRGILRAWIRERLENMPPSSMKSGSSD